MELKSDLTFGLLFNPLLLLVSEDTVVIFSLLACLLFCFSFFVFCFAGFPSKESLTIFGYRLPAVNFSFL